MENWEELKPMLREWYWLIQENKQTEEEFVNDLIHRFQLLHKETEQAGGKSF